MTRITADPAASEYVEALSPQPEGDTLELSSSSITTWKFRNVDWYVAPKMSHIAEYCPYRIGQTVELVARCQWVPNIETSKGCTNPAVAVRGFFGLTLNVCQRCLDSLSREVPTKEIVPTIRRIASIRCEQREGQWCWVVGLGEVE